MQDRREKLTTEITEDMDEFGKKARKLENFVNCCWWGSTILATLASVLGLLVAVPAVKSAICVPIEPWLISLLATGSTSLQILRKKTSWREKSNVCYARRDADRKLLERLNYQIPKEPTPDQIAVISREFGEARDIYGKNMNEINKREDEPESKLKP